jgi:hypothetical protein
MQRSEAAELSIKESGDGYELVNSDGIVIAWTLDRILALRILLALEMLDADDQQPAKT